MLAESAWPYPRYTKVNHRLRDLIRSDSDPHEALGLGTLLRRRAFMGSDPMGAAWRLPMLVSLFPNPAPCSSAETPEPLRPDSDVPLQSDGV